MFLIFRSGSMSLSDRQPLRYGPATDRIVGRANNRLGAVYSALYSFWTANGVGNQRAGSTRRPGGADPYGVWSGYDSAMVGQQSFSMRRDAYSVILFNDSSNTALVNDLTSSPDQLLDRLLVIQAAGGTNFQAALRAGQTVMLQNWSTERPVAYILRHLFGFYFNFPNTEHRS
jgi:hypothetical protein